MRIGYIFQCVVACLLSLPMAACSNWHPEVCSNGLQCPPGWGCSVDPDAIVCIPTQCGNGERDPGEKCDDGNILSADGCRSDCKSTEVCGNGELDTEVGEACDPKDPDSTVACNERCQLDKCSNGILDPGEECEDGNAMLGDGCNADCKREVCGNAVKDFWEICDDGNETAGDGCSANCKSDESCGNTITDITEVCDDGNDIKGDGCHHECQSDERCGNGYLDPGEQCDCGEGGDSPRSELCDKQQNSSNGGFCRTDCQRHCGDGYINEEEECDDTAAVTVSCVELDYDMGIPTCASCALQASACITFTGRRQVHGLPALKGIWGIGSSNVFAVGNNTILHFNGLEWVSQPSNPPGNYAAVWARGDSMSGVTKAFVVGSGGTILHYDSSAAPPWTSVSSPTLNDLTGVWGRSSDDVFAVGLKGTILHYTNGSWTDIGNAWKEKAGEPDRARDLLAIWGDGDDVFAVGKSGTIIRHEVDSNEWHGMESESGVDIESIWGLGSHFVAVGRKGRILHLDGEIWKKMESPTDISLFDVWGTGPDDIFAAGREGAIFHYNGAAWAPVHSDTEEGIYSGWATLTNVFVVGDGPIQRFTR